MDIISRAIEAFNLDVKSIELVTESYSSTVRIIELKNNEKVVLKIPFNREKISREARALELLLSNPLVPNLLNVWYGDETNIGALLMSYIEGKPMSLPINDELSFEIGKALASIHKIRLEQFELDDNENDWWKSIRNRFKSWLIEIDGHIPLELKVKLEKFFELEMNRDHKVAGPCLVHFDYRPGNLLVENGKLVGVIDFETSRGGSAEIDFTKIAEYIWKVYPNMKNAFIRGYESIAELPDIEETLPLFSIHNAVGGLVWCVRRSKLDDQFFYENLNLLEKSLNEY